MTTTEAQLSEVFCSFQGEGLYLGERQIFVRFAGCNLNCQYCDTPQALVNEKEFKYQTESGQKNFMSSNNPATISQLIDIIKNYAKPKGVNQALTLTGGEPLLQVDFIKNFIPVLKKEWSLPIYLETNGVLPDHLAEVIELVDIIAFDIKLPSATGLSPYWKEHKKALEVAYLKEVFVKIVFTSESKAKEIDDAASLIAEIDARIPLVLQPVTPHGMIKHRPSLEQLFSFHAIARRKLEKVRIIPQMHRQLGLA
jgi:organic radical activating enzyme